MRLYRSRRIALDFQLEEKIAKKGVLKRNLKRAAYLLIIILFVTQWREQSLALQDGGNSTKSYGAITLRWEKRRGF
jgi:hypothetical protein